MLIFNPKHSKNSVHSHIPIIGKKIMHLPNNQSKNTIEPFMCAIGNNFGKAGKGQDTIVYSAAQTKLQDEKIDKYKMMRRPITSDIPRNVLI